MNKRVVISRQRRYKNYYYYYYYYNTRKERIQAISLFVYTCIIYMCNVMVTTVSVIIDNV